MVIGTPLRAVREGGREGDVLPSSQLGHILESGVKQLDPPASPCPAVWITNEQTWHLSHHYKHLLKPVPL